MNVLLLSKKFPYPVKDGESLAIMNLSKGLQAQGCTLSLLAMNTSKHYFAGDQLPADLHFFKELQAVPVDNRVKPLPAFLNLFSANSYHIERFISADYEQALRRLLAKERFDIIQLETIYLGPYIPLIRQLTDAPIVMRAHNLEYEIWERIAHTTGNPLKRSYIRYLTEKLKRYEIKQLQAYDLLAAITARDQANFRKLGYAGPDVVVPIGLDAREYRPDAASFDRPLSLSFIGSLDWMPNLDGLRWFLDQVWQPYHRRLPGLSLHIAGRNTPAELHRLASAQLQVHGEVPDARQFINAHSVMVVPLHSGSGMRAKILEAMALGKVVLTTTLGLEGIEAEPGSEVLIADSPEAFYQQLQFCLEQPEQLRRIGAAARRRILQQYDNHSIAQQLSSAYQRILQAAKK